MTPYRPEPRRADDASDRAAVQEFRDEVRAPVVAAKLWLVLAAYVVVQLAAMAWSPR